MRIRRAYINEFRFWFAYGQACGFQGLPVRESFGRFIPHVISEEFCYRAFCSGYVCGQREAMRIMEEQ